jgi:hypothetical protein
MGWSFYAVDSLPALYSVVWCKWPQRRLEPGVVRPVLVRETRIMEDRRTALRYGAVLVSFATGDLFKDKLGDIDLIIDDWTEVRALGRHKPTRFSCDPQDRRLLPWGDQFFVAPEYVRGRGIIMGQLNQDQINRLNSCLVERGSSSSLP